MVGRLGNTLERAEPVAPLPNSSPSLPSKLDGANIRVRSRWMPTPVFQGVAIFGKGKEIRQCNKHKSEWESLVGLGPAWSDEGVRSMNCNRMLRIVNMGSRRGPNLRVGAEVRFIVGGTCTDCMYNTMCRSSWVCFGPLKRNVLTVLLALSMGAFRELTGGALDPPGQIDVAWEFADTE